MKSDGKVNQPSTKKAGIQGRESTISDQLASTQSDNRKSIYLLTVGSHNINNQDGRQYTKRQFETFDNYQQSKTIYPKSNNLNFINNHKRKWNGSRTYLESQSNNAVADPRTQSSDDAATPKRRCRKRRIQRKADYCDY